MCALHCEACAPAFQNSSMRVILIRIVLTEQGAGLREDGVAVASVEDASQILSQLQMLDLVLSDGDVRGPESTSTTVHCHLERMCLCKCG